MKFEPLFEQFYFRNRLRKFISFFSILKNVENRVLINPNSEVISYNPLSILNTSTLTRN